jgi:hypothetical protein
MLYTVIYFEKLVLMTLDLLKNGPIDSRLHGIFSRFSLDTLCREKTCQNEMHVL